MCASDAASFRTRRAVSDARCVVSDAHCVVSDTKGARALSPHTPHAPCALRRARNGASGKRAELVPGCSACRRASAFGNCCRPVEAGLADRFMLARHPAGGRDCPVFVSRQPEADPEVEARLAELLAAGVLDAAEAEHARQRHRTAPAEWAALLDALEQSARWGMADPITVEAAR